jgi:S1-C subfamily serine protease
MKQNKKNKKTILTALCLGEILLFITGCASIKQPEVYKRPDYTLADVRKIEIQHITELLDEKPVQALWLAYQVDDKSIIDTCTGKIAALYAKAYASKDYFTAARFYQSLEAAGYNSLSTLESSADTLVQQYNKNVPGLNHPEASGVKTKAPENVGKYIEGTVTVWVDQGVKVENGVGRADRVIGSGFFIDKNGYVVTNYHVISNCVDPKYEGYARLYVKLADDPDTRIPAKVTGWDSVLDLALLKVEVDAPYVFELGSSTDLSVGDKIYAIGSPVGLEKTLTSGIVSATNRKLFTTGGVFQIDAAVNSGNSGGPCIDVNGKVQAIVFAGMPQYQGLNFAIPVEYLETDLPMLYHGGKREHSWVGAYGHTGKEGTDETGLEVQYVMPSGSAGRSNIQAGDIITGVNGKMVRNLEDLQAEIRRYIPETLVRFTCTSGDKRKDCLVYLDRRPEYPGYEIYQHDALKDAFVPIFGMKMEAVSTVNSRKYSIIDILKGSIADESGFSVNDPVEVNRIRFSDDKSVMYTEIYAKNRKKGYLDISMALTAPLDSPYYF